MTNEPEQLLKFPCDYPLKIMGLKNNDFEKHAIEIVEKHVGKLTEESIDHKDSANGKYLSLTITINAKSREQLDKIYQDLSDHQAVLVAL